MRELDPMTERVVSDAVRLLESMGEYYGPERAMDMWNAMGREIGEDIKAEVFMWMLLGNTGNRVKVMASTCTQAVSAIKAIRAATGFGLKEAKDAWDLSKTKEVLIECTSRDTARELRKELSHLGMRVF